MLAKRPVRGASGVAGKKYIQTGHGGDVALQAVSSDYQASILEVAGNGFDTG